MGRRIWNWAGLIALAALVAVASELLKQGPPTAEAALSPSGAGVGYPTNYAFSAAPLEAGNPSNSNFSTAAAQVGTPPSNHDFSNGLSNWTTTGVVVSESGYAKLGNGDSFAATITSATFTVPSDAQVLSFRYRFLWTGGTSFANAAIKESGQPDDGIPLPVSNGPAGDWMTVYTDLTGHRGD